MYSSDLIEEVVSRNDIVDVISGYIKLKKNKTIKIRKKCDFVSHPRFCFKNIFINLFYIFF